MIKKSNRYEIKQITRTNKFKYEHLEKEVKICLEVVKLGKNLFTHVISIKNWAIDKFPAFHSLNLYVKSWHRKVLADFYSLKLIVKLDQCKQYKLIQINDLGRFMIQY